MSGALPAMLERNQPLWAGRACDFLADSGSSSADYLQAIARAGFTHWSVSYNKWTAVPERTAAAQPENAWSPAQMTTWRDGTVITEQFLRLRHTPQERQFTFPLATVRWKKEGELFWRYSFVVCDETRTDAATILRGIG